MEATSWHSYPKIFAVGHRGIANIFLDPVMVEEKLDGSQFSFGVFNGELKCRSKGAQLVIDEPEKMFALGVEAVKELAPLLKEGWTYRGEYFQKPKHNTLAYERIPEKHVMIFDINTGLETYLNHDERLEECRRLGLECVPVFYRGMVTAPEQFKEFLNCTSVLGGQRIEGVVVKNHTRFGIDGRAMMGKFVSELFKEVHNGEWRSQNPTNSDIIDKLIFAYRTPARWSKAVQRLRESGQADNSPKDIGALLKSINLDVLDECADDIKQRLFDYAWPKIARGITAGFPNWFKEKLLKEAFPAQEEPPQ